MRQPHAGRGGGWGVESGLVGLLVKRVLRGESFTISTMG